MKESSTDGEGQPFFRGPAIWIALAGVVPLSLFVQWSDMAVGGTMVAGAFPPLAASLFWALLLGINVLSAWLRGGRALLNRGELLLILAVWLIANMVAGRGLLHPLLASIVGPTYYARTPAMTDALGTHIPDWLAITDKAAARGFFEGHSGSVPWNLWVRPLLAWSFFFLPFITANICLCALFEKVWVRQEKLSFPLVTLPIESVGFGPGGTVGTLETVSPTGTREATSTLVPNIRVPFLIGLGLPVLLHGFGVLNAYYPSIPAIPNINDLSGLFPTYPWTVLRPVYLNIHPILIGASFLAPTDVTLGVWFFLLVNKIQMFLAAVTGWNDGLATSGTKAVPPFVEEQSAGAYLALGAMLLWHARSHLRKIGEAMWTAEGPATEYTEYRPLAWGFILGISGILIWCVVIGVPAWLAVLFFGFYFLVALVLSRLMAEGGVSWVLAPILPDKLILSLFGSTSVTPGIITRLVYFMQHLRDTRQMLAPAVFETGKMRDVTGFPILRFYGLLLAAIIIALVTGVWQALPLLYERGAVSLVPISDGVNMSTSVIPQSGVSQAAARLQTPVPISLEAGVAVGIGALVAYALSELRLRFFWWPLHPLGYALTGTLQLGYANKMLFSIFVGWAFKVLTQRYGGMRGFRYLRGAAFGLIVGDLLMGGIIKALDALLGPSEYAIF